MSEKWQNSDRHGAVFLTLFIFGVAYNAVVDWLHKRGYERGSTAWLVVVGVVATILIPRLIFGWRRFSISDLSIAFVGSGLPMIAGAWMRFVLQLEAERASVAWMEDMERMQNGRPEPTFPPAPTAKNRRL